jgi:hypothetical protein
MFSKGSFLRSVIILSVITQLFISNIYGQENKPFFQFDRHNLYIDYLINSGRILIPHPLNQPYRVNELLDSLPPSTSNYSEHWTNLLTQDLLLFSSRQDTLQRYGKLVGDAEVGSRIINNNNNFDNYFFSNISLAYSYKNLGFYYRFDADEAFRNDTNYFGGTGKLEKPLSYRTGIAYLQWESKFITLFVGRMSQNFGILNEPGLLLSSNPFSYDYVGLQFTNRLLKFSYLFTRLEDIYGYDIRDSITTPYWNKRYLSVHRLELSLSQKLKLAFSGSVIYGGKNQQILFQYLNPVNIFYISKLSDRKGYEEGDANVLVSFELLYKPVKKISIFTQFLIDDMDFTKDLRKQYPDRIGLSSKFVYSDPFPGAQIYLRYNRISNWTYNSFYNWGNYIYYGKSLGYPKNGVENITFGLDVFRFSPFILKLFIDADKERQQDLESPFIAKKTSFPIGIPQKSSSVHAEAVWFPKSWIYASLMTEYVQYKNYQSISGNHNSFLNFYLTVRLTGLFTVMK